MSRRAARPEQEFGSDSFLDVIANIVGILIILIVVVGVRVARQPPLELTDRHSETTSAVTELSRPKSDADPRQQERIAAELRSRLSDAMIALDDLVSRESEVVANDTALQNSSGAIASQIRATAAQLADARQSTETTASLISELSRQKDATADQMSQLVREVATVESELTMSLASLTRLTQSLTSAREERSQLDASLRETVLQTQQLKEVLTALESVKDSSDRLQHRLSPVSETVGDDQIHFRMAGGQISYVPLAELIARLKVQFRSRQADLLRFPRLDGAVGPVSGYNMKYSVERESTSALEALQYGSGTWTVSVTGWTITPDPSLDAETIARAVLPESQFRQQIEVAAPGSTVTLWVYPDSFRHLPAIREIAHGLQLRVAARPLPEGTPIAGSPGGARSTAQ